MSHSRNPGFDGGNHWVVCDVCGFHYRSSEMRERWDGAVVCKADYETRHQQGYVKAKQDVIAAQGLVRTPPVEDEFVGAVFSTRLGVAETAIASCAIAGLEEGETIGGGLPSGTFSGSGL